MSYVMTLFFAAFSSLARLYVDTEAHCAVVRRRSLLTDVLELYGTADILSKSLKISFDGETGDDFGGLTKEMFTYFWSEAYKSYFRGENCKVPFLPLYRFRKESGSFVAIGRVLTHMASLAQSVPCLIARSSYINMIFRDSPDDDCLLADLLLFVTESERKLLRQALHSFNSLTDKSIEDLTEFFVQNGFMELPKAAVIHQQIVDIAHDILVTKAEPFLALMRKGIPDSHIDSFWSQVTTSDLEALIKLQRPSPDRVAAGLRMSVDEPRPEESAVFYFLTQFVKGLSSEELQAFLQFVTGSIDMPLSGISVSFFGTSAAGRHVVAHTCSNTIEISTAYSTFQEFRREVLKIISDEHCFEFSLV